MITPVRTLRLTFFCLLLVAGCGPDTSEAPDATESSATGTGGAPFAAGERIVFFGDSITEMGDQPGGYVRLVADSLARAYPELDIEVIGAGISGNKVPDLLARVDRDVLAHDPSTVVIYIGINDVWHWTKHDGAGTTAEDFEQGLHTLVDTLQQAGADVVLCTPSVIGEQAAGTNDQDDMLDEYAQISRDVAVEEGASVCDLRAAFVDYLAEHNTEDAAQGVLTTDGVHLNEAGNRFVAAQMIEALENRQR